MATATVNITCADIKRTLHGSRLGQFAANEVLKGADPYVPFRTGQLAASAVAEPWRVRYRARYARHVYYGKGKSFSRSVHSNATAEWGKAYAKANGARLAAAMTNYLKRGA